MRYRYSWLLFASEDHLCASLRVQEQSTNMTSQRQYPTYAWRHRSIVVPSQCYVKKDPPWRQWRNQRSIIVFSGIVCPGHKIACKKKMIHSLPWITIFGSLVKRFAHDFHSWLRHSWKLLANRLIRDPNTIIRGNSCIILYIYWVTGVNRIRRTPISFFGWTIDDLYLKNTYSRRLAIQDISIRNTKGKVCKISQNISFWHHYLQ